MAEPVRTTSGSFRLQPGAIPVNWSRPAEATTDVPRAAAAVKPGRRRPTRLGPLIGLLAVAGLLWGAVAYVDDGRPALVDLPRAPAVTSTVATSTVATSTVATSTVATSAPALAALPPPTAPAPIEAAEAPTVYPGDDLLDELPAHKKARGLTQRAEGWLLKGLPEKAKPLLERAAALDPNYPEAWRSLGITRARLGEVATARSAYERYVALAPDATDAPDVRRILGQ